MLYCVLFVCLCVLAMQEWRSWSGMDSSGMRSASSAPTAAQSSAATASCPRTTSPTAYSASTTYLHPSARHVLSPSWPEECSTGTSPTIATASDALTARTISSARSSPHATTSPTAPTALANCLPSVARHVTNRSQVCYHKKNSLLTKSQLRAAKLSFS